MKNFKNYIAFLAVFALLFTSCSKEETGTKDLESENATLSFGAIVNDLSNRAAASKQATGDFPACSEDDPFYVEIILMQGDEEVVGTAGDPYRVNLAVGQVFTVEDPALELDPGNYTLDHFAVYNEGGDLIWLAPRNGSAMGGNVDHALPLAIDLRAGVKKYVDVSVLCFDDREVNQYGYLFFELDMNSALEFCFFANYCDENGRHYTASYSVNIWEGTSANGTPLYTGVTNTTGQYENGDFYASPLCFALPDNDDVDEDYLYYEVTLMNWEENYGTVAAGNTITGTLSKQDIMENFRDNDEVEYEHLKFGCGDDGNGGNGGNGGTPPEDSDRDGLPDTEDNCPNEAGPADNGGCPVVVTDTDGDGIPDTEDQCPNEEGPASNNGCPVTVVDSDGDGISDGEDSCPLVTGPASNNGCPEEVDPCANLAPVCSIPQTNEDLEANCFFAYPDASNPDAYVVIESAEDFVLENILADAYGNVSTTLNGTSIVLTIDGAQPTDVVSAYEIEVRPSNPNGTMSTTCWQSACDADVTVGEGEQGAMQFTFSDLEYSYPYFVRITTIVCETPIGGGPGD